MLLNMRSKTKHFSSKYVNISTHQSLRHSVLHSYVAELEIL